MALARADVKTGATICSGSSIVVSGGGEQSYLELVLLGLSSRAGVEEIDSENLRGEEISIIVMNGRFRLAPANSCGGKSQTAAQLLSLRALVHLLALIPSS